MIRFSKIRLILGCCLLLVLFNSCRPKEILSREEMANVLFDIHLTEATVSGQFMTVPEEWTQGMQKEYFKEMAYRSVLRKYKLNEETFYASVAWYSRHLNLYEKVYSDVQKKMDEFKTEVAQGKFEKDGTITILGLDSLEVRSMYTFGLYRPDTMPVTRLYLSADSLPTSSSWLAAQWLYALQKDTAELNLYPKLSIHSVFNTSDPDSLRVLADSLLRQPMNPGVQKEVLAPGARRLPTRNLRQVPKDEQIRKRFQQRAVDHKRLNSQDAERQRLIDAANKKEEQNHWKN